MKHRSVIAFVIVAAALFSAPQLSHDLQNLRNGLGARLRGELLQAFLSLHPEDGAAAVPTARVGRTLVAACPKGGMVAPAAKARKEGQRAASEPKSGETAAGGPAVALAMITGPENGPDALQAEAVRVQADAIGEAVAARGEIATELAMIIPPDAGIDPPRLKALSAGAAKVREGAAPRRREAEELRRLTFVAAHFEGGQGRWQMPSEEALRKLRETLPGNFEFRLDSNGSKVKTLKVIKRAVEAGRPAAAPAPAAPKLPVAVACIAPTVGSQDLTTGE